MKGSGNEKMTPDYLPPARGSWYAEKDLSLDIRTSFASFVFTRRRFSLFLVFTRHGHHPSLSWRLCSLPRKYLHLEKSCKLLRLGCSLPSATDSLSLFPILSFTQGTPASHTPTLLRYPDLSFSSYTNWSYISEMKSK